MSDTRTKPNPNQPDRCPSIDPHDVLQCGRRIHEDDQCRSGGIAWKKGTPGYVSAEERLAHIAVMANAWRAEATRYARYADDSEYPEMHAAISKTLTQNADALAGLLGDSA